MSVIEYDEARKVLLAKVDHHKRAIISGLESGARNYEELEAALALYKEYLRASDVLAGYIVGPTLVKDYK